MNRQHKIHEIWAVSDGRDGMQNQATGLAEAISKHTNASILQKIISIQSPFRKLPTFFWGDAFSKLDDPTVLPALDDASAWPDIWIACGRVTLPFSRALKEKGHSFVVQTQNPRSNLADFDLIIPPYHDQITGDNVLPIIGSPNKLTSQGVSDAANELSEEITSLKKPVIAVLIGGSSKSHRLSFSKVTEIIDTLRKLHNEGFSLIITTSRRTGEENTLRLKGALRGTSIYFHDVESDEPNPYPGMLALTDHILVTEDSTNMITEAATTGKPVHILSLQGGSTKFRNLLQSLETKGIAKPLTLPLETWSYTPLQETDRAAREIIKLWGNWSNAKA